MLLYGAVNGLGLLWRGRRYRVEGDWDGLFTASEPARWVRQRMGEPLCVDGDEAQRQPGGAPIGRQEVWAAGVTYRRSRDARMAESRDGGGASHYDRVYDAPRPELFFKASPHRVVGPGGSVRIRRDATWSVPEPELTLAVNPAGLIFGYTIGNDMSSRDIEAENPLYLPQAKVYSGCCALGPAVLVDEQPPDPKTPIELTIRRDGGVLFEGRTVLANMKRSWTELVDYLFRDNAFPLGCYLMTGTGIVPPDDLTLRPGDDISITIPPIGTLTNRVAS